MDFFNKTIERCTLQTCRGRAGNLKGNSCLKNRFPAMREGALKGEQVFLWQKQEFPVRMWAQKIHYWDPVCNVLENFLVLNSLVNSSGFPWRAFLFTSRETIFARVHGGRTARQNFSSNYSSKTQFFNNNNICFIDAV